MSVVNSLAFEYPEMYQWIRFGKRPMHSIDRPRSNLRPGQLAVLRSFMLEGSTLDALSEYVCDIDELGSMTYIRGFMTQKSLEKLGINTGVEESILVSIFPLVSPGKLLLRYDVEPKDLEDWGDFSISSVTGTTNVIVENREVWDILKTIN
jgi:hypothetical protein